MDDTAKAEMLLTNKNRLSKHAEQMECGLCWETFTMTDEVFHCEKMHVFHTRCYEDRVPDDDEEDTSAMLNKCPTCGCPMVLTEY